MREGGQKFSTLTNFRPPYLLIKKADFFRKLRKTIVLVLVYLMINWVKKLDFFTHYSFIE